MKKACTLYIYIFFFLPPFPERLVWMIYRAQKERNKKKKKKKISMLSCSHIWMMEGREEGCSMQA